MSTFADIAFPAAVRQVFTYSVPEALAPRLEAGMRVWVPFQKHNSIGMVVEVHGRQPDFNTRPVKKVLDSEPVLSRELLDLTEWIHRFYYCGWGEAIQAALPAGMNFYSEKHLKPGEKSKDGRLAEEAEGLSPGEQEILAEIAREESYLLNEARKRWGQGPIDRLVKTGALQVWEEPVRKVSPRTVTLWEWAGGGPEKARSLVSEYRSEGKSYKWIDALELLAGIGLPEFQQELYTFDLLDSYTLKRIEKEGLIASREVESADFSLKLEHDPGSLKVLNEEQENACGAVIKALDKEEFAGFLLFGITGSGKTEVYIHALKHVLEQGKGGLVLVPEIGLTPQIVRRFYRVFGDTIAVIHSRLTDRERHDAWKALQKGHKKIAIGARSAVFAPVQNLGLIIVDEEHDSSYKQEDPAPRYHARDAAIMRASLNNTAIVMGSATPSLVSLHGVRRGKSTLLSLTKRPLEARLPEVRVLDLKQYRSAMKGPLAIPLHDAIREALGRGEQVILLYNRRGYASFLQCTECGHFPECPNCSVSLTYHKSKRQLRCHYCGYSQRAPRACAACGGDTLENIGSGTQQLEEQIEQLFPEAGALRMDFDTTSGKNAHAELLAKFSRHEKDILVGTQIVGKGLDFPNVTVVGVINADTELAFPSFRAGERMFQLLSQVAGRSGRAEKEGVVYFQTWQSDHPAIQAAKEHQYKTFAKQELAFRKTLSYPPYSRLIRFIFKGRQEEKVGEVAEIFTQKLMEVSGSPDSVLGPSPAALARIQKYFRWESIIKIHPDNGARSIENLLDRTFERFESVKPDGASTVRINVNVDALE